MHVPAAPDRSATLHPSPILSPAQARLGTVRSATLDPTGRILATSAQWRAFGRPGGRGRDVGDNYLMFLVWRVSTNPRSGFVGIEPFGQPETVDHLRSILNSRPSVEAVAVGVDLHQVPCLLAVRVDVLLGEDDEPIGFTVVETDRPFDSDPEPGIADRAADGTTGPRHGPTTADTVRLALLEALISTVPFQIYWKDANLRYLGCNQAFADKAGLGHPSEVVGLSDYELPWAEGGADAFRQEDARVLATAEPDEDLIDTVIQRDGSIIYAKTSRVPMLDASGQAVGVFGIFHDVTATVEMEQALSEDRSLLRQILAHVPFHLAWVDCGARFRGANPTFAKAAGLRSEDELVNLRFEDLPEPDGVVRALAGDLDPDAIAASVPTTDHRIPVKSADGALHKLTISRVPIVESGGTVTGLVLIAIDETDRDLLERRLADAGKMEAIGQLAAGLAHEINTPLHFVGDNMTFLGEGFEEMLPLLQMTCTLASDLASEDPDGPAARLNRALEATDLDFLVDEVPRAIKQSRLGLDRVSRIIRAMKEFSHPGGDDRDATDLNRIIENAVAMATNEWKYVADIAFDLDPDLPLVTCRSAEIGQVFLIMVVNAAQAIAEQRTDQQGRGRISIATSQVEDQAVIRIADDGPGIPVEVEPRIFDPFFTTKAVGTGSGQGLAIAYNIVVNDHRGAIDVLSGEDGTTFVISLPMTEKAALDG